MVRWGREETGRWETDKEEGEEKGEKNKKGWNNRRTRIRTVYSTKVAKYNTGFNFYSILCEEKEMCPIEVIS
jgi:hypothetical protein